jgi:arsenite methyltransferase
MNERGDVWSAWVLGQRHGSDQAALTAMLPQLEEARDLVLDGADLRPGMRVCDVGCGDGLVGFGALARTGNAVEVTFVDISPGLVEHTEAEAVRLGIRGQCSFLTASAESLDAIASESFDVVTARAVLAYLPDKTAVLREFRRVLRPGGRLSLCDPIFQDNALALHANAERLASGGFGERARQVELLHRWHASQLPDTIAAMATNPLTNFNERDLFRFCEAAGFSDVHVELRIDKVRLPVPSWEAMLSTASLAGAPTLAEVLESSYTEPERAEFKALVGQFFKDGVAIERRSTAYVVAIK